MNYGGRVVPHAPLPLGAAEGVPAPERQTDPQLCPNPEQARAIETCADRDATGFTIELPLPPSVNRYATRFGNKSHAVLKWRRVCDGYLFSEWRELKKKAVSGEFIVDITWTIAEFKHSDWDNRIKPLMDYLQDRGLIQNDRFCQAATVGWGNVAFGCRVRIEPVRGP